MIYTEIKWLESLPKRPDNSILMAIEGIKRRLEQNIDNAEGKAILGTWQEIFIIEAEKRGLTI